MTSSEIRNLRLINQQIIRHHFNNLPDLVEWMGAVQAQDYAASRWAVGMRLANTDEQEVEKAVNQRKIVRTWLLRGTLHLVSASDAGWMNQLIGPRLLAKHHNAFLKSGFSEAVFHKITQIFIEILSGGKQLSRKELFDALEHQGISAKGEKGSDILYFAGFSGLLCMGNFSGKQMTYALLDEWISVKTTMTTEEALTALALRYFQSHGPATLQDFVWWSGLSVTEAKIGLENAGKSLRFVNIDGQRYWFTESVSLEKIKDQSVFLLPPYDEYFLGYKDRSMILDPAYRKAVEPGNGFSPTFILNEKVAGTWRREIGKNKVKIEVFPFEILGKKAEKALEKAVEQYASFLKLPCEFEIFHK
ncbi:Winged helix DNA-binding domain-containing protein [Pseudarcicella hirudinis]|uniref:Winged helix DNA-binding domain-containing protein n=1 Tax=Pseudarcicella hirudinis TaxID=1079859 RepID=A0A1I5Y914_9BACT|nr:winged helix DNA-binding domain-containing protein [Pseudarcicella hirudinis]SFQ40688.1 Winged helix DNA-binding domain-containing protein [Pseudarcicella hirudinis]